MRLSRNILELLEAIPDRIEVSGQEPTWQVTGGSFDDVVSYANDAFDKPAVISRQDRSRWWPRVTLTVTTDPDLAAGAPPLAALADPEPLPVAGPVDTEQPSGEAEAALPDEDREAEGEVQGEVESEVESEVEGEARGEGVAEEEGEGVVEAVDPVHEDPVDRPAEDSGDDAVLAFLEGAFARQAQEHEGRRWRFPRQRDGRHL
jgi:hypothetical protein